MAAAFGGNFSGDRRIGGIAEDDVQPNRQKRQGLLLREAKGRKAVLHAGEENDREVLLQRNVAFPQNEG